MLYTCGHEPGPPQVFRDLHVPIRTAVSSRLSKLLGRSPEPPRVPQTRAQAQAFRWKLAHVSRIRGRGHKTSAGSSLTHPH